MSLCVAIQHLKLKKLLAIWILSPRAWKKTLKSNTSFKRAALAFSLAGGNYLLVLVNDLVRGWLAWTLPTRQVSFKRYYFSLQENLLILRGGSKGKLQGVCSPSPHPLRWPAAFYYNWYSVLKFLYITSQLFYSLNGAPPPKKSPGSAPVLDYWMGLFTSPVTSIPWTPLNTMANDGNFDKINSRQTPLQKHSNSDISCAGVPLSSL